jgi:glycerophosphoryl diester phosphodiesterase
MKAQSPVLVAHRGDPTNYPENTLIGLRAALAAGATAIEFDLQLTADGIPVLMHDESLARVTGIDRRVFDLRYIELADYRACEPERFGNRFKDIPITSLGEIVSLLREYPHARAFVELKRHSLTYFGNNAVLTKVAEIIEPVRDQCVLLSFVSEVLIQARQLQLHHPIAWIVRRYDDEARQTAESLQPEFLCCNLEKIPGRPATLWQGPWRWMLYETSDPRDIARYAALGVEYLETNDITAMLKHSKTATAQRR